MNWFNKFSEEKSKENKINSTNATIIWIKSREKRFLIQVLKNQLVEFRQRERNANGESSINIFIIIYRREYEKIRFNNESLRVLWIKPSTEKISKELVFTDIFEFIKLINSEKHIFFPKSVSPWARIASEI